MCRDAFKFLISVSNQKLVNIINDLDKGFKKRTHKNTGKVFDHHFLIDEKTSIIEWIKDWTNKNAIRFTKCKNNITLWLSFNTTLVQIYNIYTLDPNTIKISLESFRRYFKTLEYIKFECNCKKQSEKKEIRFNIEELLCPISKGLMYNPVIASDGFNYEKSEIEEWIKISQKSPMTNEKILKKIYENVSLKCKIALFISEFKKDYIKLQNVIEDITIYIDWIIMDSENTSSNFQEDSIDFLVEYYTNQKDSSKAIAILENSGNTEKLLEYLNKYDMKDDIERLLMKECPLMKTYFKLKKPEKNLKNK
jgi:hypothetical protein